AAPLVAEPVLRRGAPDVAFPAGIERTVRRPSVGRATADRRERSPPVAGHPPRDIRTGRPCTHFPVGSPRYRPHRRNLQPHASIGRGRGRGAAPCVRQATRHPPGLLLL